MTKKFLIILAMVFLFSCSKETIDTQNIESLPLPEKYSSTLDEEKKVELARERRKEQMQLRKGDYMMSKHNPEAALEFYLPLVAKLPDDIVLYKKIANAYFLLKNWEKAYSYYVRVPLSELTEEDQSNMILSLFYREDAIDKNNELQKFAFTDEQKDFYNVMTRCYEWINTCADVLWNYEWTEERLWVLKKIVQDSYKITPDVQYRNLLIAKQMYEYKMYRIVGMITSEILANEQNYQEAKKMRAFALYELGKYQEAKELLLSYLESNSEDMEVIIRLGEVHAFLKDYISANLYFNNAILAWYTPKTILERRLAYNYAKLDDTEGMVKVLTYLLQEQDVAEDDYAVAISLAQEKQDYARAYSWASAGIRKFPGSKILTPLYLQSLRTINKRPEAMVYLSGLSEEISNLPMVQLEKGILMYEQNNFEEAKRILSFLKAYDDSLDFSIEANQYLDLIEQAEKQQNQEETASGASHSFWDF